MIKLLTLDRNVWVNPEYIVQITIVNLESLRRERGQHHQTPEQREREQGKFWEVSVYLRSENYNPQRFTKRFRTEQEARKWTQEKFGAAFINSL